MEYLPLHVLEPEEVVEIPVVLEPELGVWLYSYPVQQTAHQVAPELMSQRFDLVLSERNC